MEFDALLLAGVPGIATDGFGARDAKAGNGTVAAAAADPRVLLMLAEAYRHSKPSPAGMAPRKCLRPPESRPRDPACWPERTPRRS